MRGIKKIISTLVVMSMCFSLVAVMPVSAETTDECTPYPYMGTADHWYVNENFDDRTGTVDEESGKYKLNNDSEDTLSAYSIAPGNGYLVKDNEAETNQYMQLYKWNNRPQSIKELTVDQIKNEKNLTFSFKYRNNQTSYATTEFFINGDKNKTNEENGSYEIFHIYHNSSASNQGSIFLQMKNTENGDTPAWGDVLTNYGVNMGTSAAWHDFSFEMERVAAETEGENDYVKITAFVDGKKIGGEYK